MTVHRAFLGSGESAETHLENTEQWCLGVKRTTSNGSGSFTTNCSAPHLGRSGTLQVSGATNNEVRSFRIRFL